MIANQGAPNRERTVTVPNGWLMLVLLAGALLADVILLVTAAQRSAENGPGLVPVFALALPLIGLLMVGFFTLQPNEARVLVLFGDYKGTVRESGFHWANPFYTSGPQNIRLPEAIAAGQAGRRQERARRGTAARAGTQQDLAARPQPERRQAQGQRQARQPDRDRRRRRLARRRHGPGDVRRRRLRELRADAERVRGAPPGQSVRLRRRRGQARATLRGHVRRRVARRCAPSCRSGSSKAGVTVEEARLTHLAYAPEIAQAMLRRQQAEAVIAARQKIVHGAVSMVQMALTELAEKQVVELDDERRAAMVSNLMVVLCGESEVQPVVNTGTLYN